MDLEDNSKDGAGNSKANRKLSLARRLSLIDQEESKKGGFFRKGMVKYWRSQQVLKYYLKSITFLRYKMLALVGDIVE